MLSTFMAASLALLVAIQVGSLIVLWKLNQRLVRMGLPATIDRSKEATGSSAVDSDGPLSGDGLSTKTNDRVHSARLTDRSTGSVRKKTRTDRPRLDSGDRTADPVLISLPSLEREVAPSPEIADALARRFGLVWALEDAGHSDEEVSRLIPLPIGEVKLILGLRHRATSPDDRRLTRGPAAVRPNRVPIDD